MNVTRIQQGLVWGMGVLLIAIGCLGCNKSNEKKKLPAHQNSNSEKNTVSQTDKAAQAQKKTEVVTDESLVAKGYFGKLPYSMVTPDSQITSKPKKPNVILLVIDAMNVKHMSTFGYKRKTTPNLTKLANQGIVFTNYISNSSWTRPSFTTIITGMTKKEHGVELRNRDVAMNITTLAEHFRLAGYRTGGFTGNPLTKGGWGFQQGYQTYVDTHTLERAFPPDFQLTQHAIEWMNRTNNEPFFIKIFYTAPHTPYRPVASAKHFVKQFKNGKVIEYPFREYKSPIKKDDYNMTVAAYDDEVRYTDRQIGLLVDHLETMGVAQNTAIVVTGDHGEMFGQHGCFTHTYHMWEEALRVPMVIYLPWHKTDGCFSDNLFSHVDIMPTLLEIAGIENHEAGKLSGKSILSQMTRPKKKKFHLSQYNAHGIQRQALRHGRYKLIHHHKVFQSALGRMNRLHANLPHANPNDLPSLAVDGERFELYDLVTDPKEKKDLYPTMKEMPEFKELYSYLAPLLGEKVEDDNQISPEILEALKNAGYIQ